MIEFNSKHADFKFRFSVAPKAIDRCHFRVLSTCSNVGTLTWAAYDTAYTYSPYKTYCHECFIYLVGTLNHGEVPHRLFILE